MLIQFASIKDTMSKIFNGFALGCGIFIIISTDAVGASIDTVISKDFSGGCNVTAGNYSNSFGGYHTGDDYFCSKAGTQYKTITFGRVVFLNSMPVSCTPSATRTCPTGQHDHGMGNVLEITHLLSDGSEVTSSYNHSASFDILSQIDRHVVNKQNVGSVGATGQGQANYWTTAHLHFEMKIKPRDSNMAGPWGYTGGTNYGNYPGLPSGYGYVIPSNFFNVKEMLLPILSKSSSPNKNTNFSVYGVASENLYGYLGYTRNDLNGAGQGGILVQQGNGITRQSAIAPFTWNSNYMGNLFSGTLGTTGFNRQASYPAGQYLFTATVLDNYGASGKYGYPVRMDVVNKGDIIVDNDQLNADDVLTNDSTTESVYNGTSTKLTGNRVPGYFLTADLFSGASNAVAQWKPNTAGTYKIYVYIPEYGATATDVVYKIKNNNASSGITYLSNSINHQSHPNQWVQLTYAGGDKFVLESTGYVGISLSATDNSKVTATEQVAFDAVKFEKVADNASVNPSNKADGILNCLEKLLPNYFSPHQATQQWPQNAGVIAYGRSYSNYYQAVLDNNWWYNIGGGWKYFGSIDDLKSWYCPAAW